ncbi:MAG TPA: L-fucose mutarotase [Clostridiaceae bacterium]|nr:L-fucose mutarotase [Clostridiaceae bacterium]
MLKNVPKNLSPELLKVLSEMGHGDEICIGDGNFPAEEMGRRVVRCDGLTVPDLLKSILELFPLDTYVPGNVFLMEVAAGDDYQPVIWEEYKEILNDSGEEVNIEYVERFAFYDQARKAYAVIATSEEALYANIILKKGVVK